MPYTFDSDDVRTYLARRYRQARGRAKSILRRPAQTFDNNNNFAQRVTLNPSGGSAAFNNTGYTRETNEPQGGTGIQRTGWYKITPTERRIFQFRMTAIPGADPRMEYYTGSTLSSLVRCDTMWPHNGGGDSARTDFGLRNLGWNAARLNDWMEVQLPAAEVQIQIGMELTSDPQGVIAFEWAEQTPPANDDLADAIELVGDFGTESGTLVGATFDTTLFPSTVWPNFADPSSFNEWIKWIRGIVWYKITALTESSYRFTLEPTGSGEDMRVIILQGDLATGVCRGWGRPDEPFDIELDNSEYWIGVCAINLGSTGEYDFSRWRDTFDLSWEQLPNASNDYFATPEEISGDTGTSTTTDISGWTLEAGETGLAFDSTETNMGSIWWHFVPDNSGLYTISTADALGAADQFTQLSIYRGDDLTELLPVDGESQFLFSSPFSFQAALRAGESYYIRLTMATVWDMYLAVSDTDFGGLSWNLDVAAPANDDFANAEVISGSSGTVSGTDEGATFEVGEFGIYYDLEDPYLETVWYVWEAPSSGYFRFETSGAEDQDLDIFTGDTVDALTPVVENIDGKNPVDNFNAIVEFEATAGTTYYIRVNFGRAAFDLEWQTATPPANDLFANSVVLASTEAGGPTNYDNLGADADLEIGEPNPLDDLVNFQLLLGRSVWFTFTPPSSGLYDFTFDCPSFSSYVALYELDGAADFANLTRIDLVDVVYDSNTLQNLLDESKTYYFQLLGAIEFVDVDPADPADTWAISQGQFTLEWTRVTTPPENDDLLIGIGNPEAVGNIFEYEGRFAPSGGCYDATSRDATAEAGELSVAGFGPQRTVWFFWSGAINGTMRFWTTSSAISDQVMAVYESDGLFDVTNPGTLLDSDDDSGPGLMPQCDVAVTDFTPLLIQIDTKDNPGGEFTLNWVRITASPPINDNFADAIELTGDGPTTLSGTTVDATVECDEPGQDGEGPYGSVWYHIFSPVDRGIELTLKATSDANDGGIRAILYRGTSLDNLEDVTDGDYPWVFDLNEEATNTFQLAGGVDYYISVSNFRENESGTDGATFDVTHELSDLTPPDGDPFEAPIDSSPSAPGGQILTGDTEGATTQDAEPEVTGVAGTVWHKFIPDYDGIYIFEVEADDPATGPYGGRLWFSVWEGPSLATIKPIPGYYTPGFGNALFLGDNPRVLRAGSTYYIRVERFDGDPWGTYTLNITSYPEYDDWTSAGAGYDSLSGSAGYDSLNDQLTCSGAVGSAIVAPWRDADDNPQDSGRRWILMRFKLRITSGETMFRDLHDNALGVVRALDEDDNSLWELIIVGNEDGTNSLAISDLGPQELIKMFAHFGTRGRDFNEWVDVEVMLKVSTEATVPTALNTHVAINGVKKRDVVRYQGDSSHFATLPIRSLEFGAFRYPDSYDTTITGAGSPRQDPHDDWEIQIKDVVVRNRPTLGWIPPTDTGDLGITQFDGWEHEDKLDNIDVSGITSIGSTIVDAPGVPPGNADWWKAVRMVNASPSDYPKGGIYNTWLENPRPWMGFWVYFASFPTTGTDDYMVFSHLPLRIDDPKLGWATLMINEEGELRVAPQLTERVWKSYCVAKLQEETWYWIELEADLAILHEATVDVSINGNAMGTFEFASSYADLTSIEPGFQVDTYQSFPTGFFPGTWRLGPIMVIPDGKGSVFTWSLGSLSGVEVDMYFAHVCMGRAVTFPLGPMQTKLFGGIDEDGEHNFPELPADVDDYEQLDTSTRENIWMLYDFTIETEDPDPAVSGTAPAGISWQTPPGGDTIDVIADGAGPALIAAYNAIRWKPRATIPDSPFGTRHFPQLGFTPYEVYTAAQGGTSSDMFVQTAWVKGVGSLAFAKISDPGNASIPSHISAALTGTYEQFWSAAPNVWHPSMASVSASTDGEWSGMTASDFMYWKRARVLLNPAVYPRFALSADDGATWTMLTDPTVSNTSDFIGSDVTVSNGEAVFMNNTSAMTRLFEFRRGTVFITGVYGMHSVGYEMKDWYLEYASVPSVEIEDAEEFGGTRGYNLHMRHAGYRYTPSTERVAGDLYVTLWNGTHRSPMHVVTATSSDITRVRYPTDATGGHWTTTEFGDTLLRFGFYRAISSSSSPGTILNPSPSSWLNSQTRGALLEAVQWEVLSQAAPGPSAQRCRRLQQIYRRAFG